MSARLPALLFCAVFSASSIAAAADNPYGIPDDVDNRLRDALNALYSFDFDTARRDVAAVSDRAADHPMIALVQATVEWWRVAANVLEADDAESQSFWREADRCLDLAEAKTEDKDRSAEAYVALGTIHGLIGRWEAANRHWISALSRGHRARRDLRRALEINPQAYDADMALGAFSYTAEAIRGGAGSANVEEDPASGLSELRTAYEKGTYLRLPAGLLLASFLANSRPEQALPILVDLRQQLFHSSFIHMMLITTLYNAGRLQEMSAEIEEFEHQIENGLYEPEAAAKAAFARGLLALRERRWEDAAALFSDAEQRAADLDPYKVWAELYEGYALDGAGRRDDAVKRYDDVLAARRRWASHDHARARLRTPFSADDPEMTKLEL